MKNNLAESIRARLLNLSKSEGSDFSTLLTRYALERFLYRIGQSEYQNIFLLKGALLFALWYDMPHWMGIRNLTQDLTQSARAYIRKITNSRERFEKKPVLFQ